MSSSAQFPSFRRQQLLLEFASLKHHCPEGIYMSLNPTDPGSWSGVYFVREGPYAAATLRFEVLFPPLYPETLPLIIFTTEIFHPLLVPLTTYSFSTGGLDPYSTISASETEPHPPGSFNLGHGFPEWTQQERESRRVSTHEQSHTAPPAPDFSASESSNQEIVIEGQTIPPPSQRKRSPILHVLAYIKVAFEDPTILDELPLHAAGNQSAWHAWRSYRGLPKHVVAKPSAGPRDPADWNWDGLWEARVRGAIEETISDALLYGNKNIRSLVVSNEPIRFSKLDDDKLEDAQTDMLSMYGFRSLPVAK